MSPARFSILLISIYLSFNFLFVIPVWAQNNLVTSQYTNQTNISEPNNLAYQYLEGRLNLLDSRVNDLVQSRNKPQKDCWDIIGTLSILVSGVIVGGVSIYATNRYQHAQLTVAQMQIIQSFMTQLPSKDYRVVTATLRSIAVMNPDIALNLSEIFYYNGGLYALIGWSEGSDVELARRANEILRPLVQNSLLQALDLYNEGMSRQEVVEEMKKTYMEQPGVTKVQIEQFADGIDYLLRSQKKK